MRAALALLPLLLGACACDTPPASGGPDLVAVTPTASDAGTAGCDEDGACPFGQVCRGGLCRPSDPGLHDEGCWSDGDCPEGKVCATATGRCVEETAFPAPPVAETGACAEGESRFCGTKVGACEYGVERCVDGAWSGTCEGGTRPTDEVCDGDDNDCDGDTDEGFDLGLPCDVGTGACAQSGQTVCAAGGLATTCSATPLDPAGRVELCGNQIDDDCDSDTDEGFELGVACSAGQGACARSGATVCSGDLLGTVCSAAPAAAAPAELCGAQPDDDCDGEQEEGFELVGTTCSAGVGACTRVGTWVCSADQASVRCSATAGAPAPAELCGNDIDDDCDGETDETFEMEGASCTLGTATCPVPGVLACATDGLSLVCTPTSPGGVERCNGADDDGDNCVDEDFNVGVLCSAGRGVCRALGQQVCLADGSGTSCDAVPGAPNPDGELCGNGRDDDCDGSVDEGFPTLGDVCQAGLGACQRSGAVVCSADGLATVCDAVPAAPGPDGELCGNALDDDCNGQTDEGFDVGDACTVGLGVCQRTGVKVCAADGRGTVCSVSPGAANPAGELCGNGLDDDCDGSADEGFDVGAACSAGTGICARAGQRVCSADRLTTVCNAVPAAPNPDGELCGNALDDDCDTFVDEGFPSLGNPCVVGLGECRRTGVFQCAGDRLSAVCSAAAGTPAAEVCDDLDNDCNGAVDNGCDDDGDDYCDAALALVGAPAACPLTTGASVMDCNDNDAAVHPGAAEVCGDARDQNCDGAPSEGCPMCDVTVDADFDGANECDDCDETNGAVFPGALERCDGLDNDCQGGIDEDFDSDGDGYTTCGTMPGGGLDPAFVDCDDANGARHPFACELCALGAGNTVACGAANDRGNGVDEDCDGYTDELCAPCSAADPDGDGASECDGDCAPADPAVSPLVGEVCDGKDTDCNTFTTDNCVVGDACNWPGTPPPDECGDGLLCVESLGGGGNPTGQYSCTSLCNFSEAGLGLGDGCEANQTCSSSLTPTANLHGCQVATDIGALLVGQSCADDAQCRSGSCYRDQRANGAPDRYCSDLCASDAYCATGTKCQAWGADLGRCLKPLSFQTRDVGAACNDTTVRCQAGTRACVEVSVGNRVCTDLCCDNSDCPGGYYCSLNGNDSPGPVGGYDTVPVCWPRTMGAQSRPAGAACDSNSQCASEFCDRGLGVCVDVCCHDATCPTGLVCEDVLVTRAAGHQSFARMCVNVTPAAPLERR